MDALLGPHFQAAADSPLGIVFKLGILSLAAMSECVTHRSKKRHKAGHYQ